MSAVSLSCANPIVDAVKSARSIATWSSTALKAVPSNHQVTMSWPQANDVTSYNLYWGNSADISTANAHKIENVSSPYVHSGLNNKTSYYYFVTSVGSAGESGPSAVASAMPLYLIAYITTRYGVEIYPVDRTTGAFGTPMDGPSTGYNIAFTMDSACKYAYLTDYFTQQVYSFAVDENSGALSAVGSPAAAGSDPEFIVINSNSSFVYVANAASNGVAGDTANYSVSGYKVSSSDGSLSLLPGCPWVVGDQIGGLSVSPDRRFLYLTTNVYTHKLYGYSIDTSTGALTPIGGSPTDTPSTPGPVAFDSTSGRLYVANHSDGVDSINLWSYPVNTVTGVLQPLVSNMIHTSSELRNIRNNYLAMDPLGRFLFVGNRMNENSITVFRVNNGALSLVKVGTKDSMLIGYAPSCMAVDAQGNCLYVANGNLVESYAIDQETGALTPLASTDAGSSVGDISVVSLP